MPFKTQKQKKTPPPRPPPPKFSKYRSKSSFNLNHPSQNVNLIEWSPPSSPTSDRVGTFGGSVSSSFSSSTSSLASSKKSFEFESPITNNIWPIMRQAAVVPQINNGSTFQSYLLPAGTQTSTKAINSSNNLNVPLFFGPTIIRPKFKPNNRIDDLSPSSVSPPMPNIPPPSPPKEIVDIETPYGIVLFDYPASNSSDLALQTGDVVILLQRIDESWLYGRIMDKEGMFPESFIDVQVPLKGEENIVTAIYDFQAQMPGDLSFKASQKINVTKKISQDWLVGEYDGQAGQFPSNFVNRVPKCL